MFTVYHLNADDLDVNFLESLKATFRHKQIEIAVAEADDTEYLLRSPANRERLLRTVADVEAGRNLVTPEQQMFQ